MDETVPMQTLSYEDPKPAEMQRTIVLHLSQDDLDAIDYAIDSVLYGEDDLLPATTLDAPTNASCDVTRLSRLLSLQQVIQGAK